MVGEAQPREGRHADDLLFNEIIWKSVKGARARAAPVRAAFFVPVKAKKDDDD